MNPLLLERETDGDTLGYIPCGKATGTMGNSNRFDVPYWLCHMDPLVQG